MYIDGLPVEKLVKEDGTINTNWRNHFEQLNNQIQTFLSDERYILPQQPDPRSINPNTGLPLTEISGLNIEKNIGGLLYNTTTNSANINIKRPTTGDPVHEFTPLTSYQTVSSLAERDAIPAAERDGKLIFVDTVPTENKLFVGVKGAWREIALI